MTRVLIGWLMICAAIIMFVTFVFGWELELKEKIAGAFALFMFFAALSVGMYVMIGG